LVSDRAGAKAEIGVYLGAAADQKGIMILNAKQNIVVVREWKVARLASHVVGNNESTSEVSDDSNRWLAAIKEELGPVIHHKTWTVVKKLTGQKVLPYKWVFSVKCNKILQRNIVKIRVVVKAVIASSKHRGFCNALP
jgi:hypothetical protein